ncbi:MAG: ribonuclease R [Pseudomonadales bacterium]
MVRRAGDHGARLTAAALQRELQASGPGNLRELMVRTGLEDALGRKRLRLLLRGMLRGGELTEDLEGRFHSAVGSFRERPAVVGVIEARGRDLFFEGRGLPRVRGQRLRGGDRIEAFVNDERVDILRVLERSSQLLVGELHMHGRHAWVESLSPDHRGRVALEGSLRGAVSGNTVTVRVTGEDRAGLTGELVDILSARSGAAHAAETLLTSHGVPVVWPDAVSAAVKRLPKQVQPWRFKSRLNLESLPLVTIDGETARDFDDAVYAERRRGGGWRLIVAIADVAHYVKQGGALDQSAWERGTSVYLPDRVVPMLPEALSNELCSLRPREPRLAVACILKVSARGIVTDFEFHEAVIRSWQRLTYTRVQEFIEAGALDVEPPVQDSLRALYGVYGALRTAREARGALDFDTHEAVLELADEHVTAIHPVTRLDAHRLIEEAMIAANVAAAQFLEAGGRAGMYRVHEPPDADRSEQLRQALAYAGVRMDRGASTPADIHAALAALGDRPDRFIYEMLALRTMTQAYYSPTNKGHFGLALERYMHFTSPIRRYADLVVHRSIKALLHDDPPPADADALVRTGMQISTAERRAESVAWGVEGWLKCEHVAKRTGEVFDGVIMGVTEFGVFVELTGYFVQGLLHVSGLGSDYFRATSSGMSLVGDRSGRRFGLGDRLRVRVLDVQPSAGRIDLELVAGSGAGEARSRGVRRRSRA